MDFAPPSIWYRIAQIVVIVYAAAFFMLGAFSLLLAIVSYGQLRSVLPVVGSVLIAIGVGMLLLAIGYFWGWLGLRKGSNRARILMGWAMVVPIAWHVYLLGTIVLGLGIIFDIMAVYGLLLDPATRSYFAKNEKPSL